MYDFGEKKQEKNKTGQTVDVWVLPKYQSSKAKAIEIIQAYDSIDESDFWILKNETKGGVVMYSGLIISHTGCLKINECLEEKMRFRPECVTKDKDGYGGSLVYEYCCPEQGIYEVGEASPKNCKNPYPYAMAFKRCYDRVVLKASKLAFSGIYSESESDTFTKDETPPERKSNGNVGDIVQDVVSDLQKRVSKNHVDTIRSMMQETGTNEFAMCEYYKVSSLEELTESQYGDALNVMSAKKRKIEEKRKVVGDE